MCFQWTSKQRIRLNLPISALYLHFSVLSPFQRFTPISAFYPHFSVLSPFQRFIPISAFYPHFSVLSPFQRFIPISAFYPHFSFRFQFPFPRFSFSVLSLPLAQPRSQALPSCLRKDPGWGWSRVTRISRGKLKLSLG